MARKLACLFYRPLQYGQQYVDKGRAVLAKQDTVSSKSTT
jgi:hypothetical protein